MIWDLLAAGWLFWVGVLFRTEGAWNGTFYKVFPIAISLGLASRYSDAFVWVP